MFHCIRGIISFHIFDNGRTIVWKLCGYIRRRIIAVLLHVTLHYHLNLEAGKAQGVAELSLAVLELFRMSQAGPLSTATSTNLGVLLGYRLVLAKNIQSMMIGLASYLQRPQIDCILEQSASSHDRTGEGLFLPPDGCW